MLRVLTYLVGGALALALLAVGVVTVYLWQVSQNLPEHRQLANYEPPVMTRVYAADGRLIAEYARQSRLYVPITAIPKNVVEAFLSAEDKKFYGHGGIDSRGIVRAVIDNVQNYYTGRRFVGASTITQQVAKNFLLTNEKTFDRKVKEAILALRIEQAFTKDQILELYLNEIYLGFGSYGVAAAALNYFDKSLDQLTLAEAAFLGALPKAPNNYNPFRHYDRAVDRRNWVLDRMAEDGFVTAADAANAKASPIDVAERPEGVRIVAAEYFVEEVRREILDRYGEQKLYGGGLSVRTTLETDLQRMARRALRNGLEKYDRRHGWRGAMGKLPPHLTWQQALIDWPVPADIAPWRLATVLEVNTNSVRIGLRPPLDENGHLGSTFETGSIPYSEVRWARPQLSNRRVGNRPRSVSAVLEVGDVIYVEPVYRGDDRSGPPAHYALRQVPEVNGAIAAMDPHTGRVLAMVGGFSYELSEFNRATQAERQPGSSFKPIVYATALENGYTPTSIVVDGPIAINQGGGQGVWRPKNYAGGYFGPSTLRVGLEKSRNLMTVRLAMKLGMDKVSDAARDFGVDDQMPRLLSMALGSGETTVLRMVNAFAIMNNGGKKVTPSLIDRVQDRWGRTIYRHDTRSCPGCRDFWQGQEPPRIPDNSEQVISPQTAYQITSMMEGVVLRGTAKSVQEVGVPVAGKTGTTNDYKDAWFVGYSPNLVAGVYVGFDKPDRMGSGEAGGIVAAPVFTEFMKEAVGNEPPIPFRIPPGLDLVKVDAKTGRLASPASGNVILEAFKPGTAPFDVQARKEAERAAQRAANSSGSSSGRSSSGSSGRASSASAAPKGATLSTGSGGLY